MRFAIIGAGVIGRTHAACIRELGPRATLTLVVDEIPDRARELATAHNADHATSARAAFTRGDVDAVAICTPSGRHAEFAVAALEAGRHVLVEKPIDVTMPAARRVADAAARASTTITVISQHRFDPSSQLVHQAVRDGRLGRITSGVASIAWWRSQDYYDSGDWRGSWALDGGGALMNQGIHTVDLLLWMLGEPVEVHAWAACLAHQRIEVEDTTVAAVRFASGALGVIHSTTAAYPGLTARVQVHGDRGSAIIDGDRLTYFHAAADFHAAAGPADPPDYGAGADANQAARVLPGRAPAPTAGSDPGALSDAHLHQYRDFLDAIAGGRQPMVTVGEAIAALAVVHAIYESARTGRPVPVTLPAAGR
jgi:UDP-N-acetyl-2-amino-2-deoxyglucuronate dehydrogenase